MMINVAMIRRQSCAWLSALLLSTCCLSCVCRKSERELSDRLSVSWQLLGNTFGQEEQCRAAWTFINRGDATISGDGWRLYFNQKTLIPQPMSDSTRGWVQHINGDFYRFVPGKAFALLPQDSLRVEYAYHGIMIKESDAPTGVYVAFDDRKGGAPSLLRDFQVKPFKELETLFPGFSHLMPTPEREYAKNSAVFALPDEQIGRLIPTPVQSIKGDGHYPLTDSTVVCYSRGLESEADYLTTMLAHRLGRRLLTKEGASESGSITLQTADLAINGAAHEAYRLRVSPAGVVITGGDAAGVFYGITSLLALVDAEYSAHPAPVIAIGSVEIVDAPRFHFRGLLLDVARNFQQKAAVLKLIDLLALYKINVLNLRLTDDEGWRIEIKGLPELTEVGAKRGHTLDDADRLPPSFGSGPSPASEGNHGVGYFSREDFKEIISYAHQRHVRVVPEICFPSHARAAVKSMEARYRQYLALGDVKAAETFRLIDPDDRSVYLSAQLYNDNIACVALESSLRFYQTVVQDIVEMYREAGVPLSLFHTGGDEVPRGAWEKSPACQKLLDEHPEIGHTRNLQAYFFDKVLEILAQHNLQAGGWEEVVLRDSLDNVIVNPAFVGRKVIPYVWDNTGDHIDLGYRIANAGYPVVLCNVTNLYFDLSYNTDPREPGLYWGGFQDAKDPFVLAPFDVFKSAVYDDFGNIVVRSFDDYERLKPENRSNIMGLQAQLWTETVKGQEMMEYYLLPKIFAFAEKAWAAALWEDDPDLKSRTEKIDQAWNEFANRIGRREFPRLDRFGEFRYRIPMPGARIEDGLLKANIAYPSLTIRYTLDGSEPCPDSPIYQGPFKVNDAVRLAAFAATGRRGWIAEVTP